jgi:iron complex outermembrane receptor protein
VAAGTRIPGTARDQLFTRLQWTDAPWQAALEMTASGPIGVNDLGSERAPGHALWHLELARTWQFGGGQWRASARLENLLDASAIGSVIVNEASGRYYEPAAGRGLWAGRAVALAPLSRARLTLAAAANPGPVSPHAARSWY